MSSCLREKIWNLPNVLFRFTTGIYFHWSRRAGRVIVAIYTIMSCTRIGQMKEN